MPRRLKRILRHLFLAISGFAICLATPFLLAPVSTAQTISLGTAYASLLFLAVTLALGPLNVLRARNNPVSSMTRRDFGIWAGVSGIVHVVAGLNVHFGGRFWVYFVFPPEDPRAFIPRYDPMGLANHTGLIATLILVLLLLLSNNASLRRLKPERWKRLQRWNYALGGLLIVHGLVYQFLEKRVWPAVAFFVAVGAITCVSQILGRRACRQAAARAPDTTSRFQPSESG